MPVRTSRNDRDRLSQDSFGGAVSQDHEKDFRASAKQFHVPLSELGRASEHETDTQPVDVEPSPPDEADDLARSLLALSNSDSGGAQSQDHMSQQSMDVDINANIVKSYEDEPGQNTQASTQGYGVSQLSSSYERLLEGKYSQPDPHPDTPPAEPATQMNVDENPTPLEATQPDESSGDVVMNPSEDVGTTATPHPVGGFSNPQTGPRSLASTVNKKWRLQKLNIPVPPHPPAQSLVPSSTHDPLVVPESVIADTQPSEFTETPIPRMRTFPPPRANGLSRRKLSPVSSPPRSDMEIVPDSEPPLTGPAQLTPSQHKRPVAGARPQPQGAPPSPRKETAPAADHSKAETGESDDDDVPLAVARALPKGLQANKGKGKAVAASSAVGSNRTVADGRQNRTGASDGRSLEGGVPSSAPEQDEAKPVPAAQRGRGKGRAGKPASSASERTTRSASAASNIPAKKRRISSETDDDEDELRLKGRGPVSIPKAEKREEEEETEPADQDDYGEDVQDDNESEAGPTGRKRKRVTKPKARPKTASKASIKSNLSRGTPTLHTRPNKRLRSVNSTTTRAAEDAATRVFALWKADAHYYSGTVHSHMGASQFLVQFDDDSEATVDVSKMRRRDLRPGDELILVSDNRQAVVKQAGHNGPTVEVDDGDELESFDVEFRDLRIAVRTINKHWQDRGVDIEDVVPIIRSKSLKSTPSPSKASLLSVASSKSRGKALNKVGLVITMSSNNTNSSNANEANPDAEREKITAIVKNNGGTMIDDWSSIISMDGKHSNSNKRWVAVADDIAVNCKNGITKVYLVANDANSKPKYLIALALGIPCVHLEWVHSMAGKNDLADWQPFLLPAGSSTSLGDVRMTQMVDCEWGSSTAHLKDIMDNQVASKLFAALSILCVGRDFVPAGKTKRASDFSSTNSVDGKESSRAVPSIVLAMGARRVEAVTEAKYASDPTFKTFDFVVVKDISDSVPGLPKPNVTKLVHFPWVKESLMTGRLLPLPKW
ncbi:hypothetical protein FIBSPDRAFT_828087 [Athelia psychrophila]|uniref:BRCT domain-containing protein n=1 Tax=Athelia psychrophila TaxID=1759441 RepID=A0A166I3W7_9AGAM|nr:hypothetical protein FIBSPDRAFT_828087 [Fibularhizoctonia sp. CBS 109695]